MTYQDLFIFLNMAASWEQRTKEARASKPSYFFVVLQRVAKKNQALVQAFKDLEEDAAIANAALDKEGNLKHDAQGPYGYAYTPAGLQVFNKAVRELKQKTIEPETMIITAGVPKDLSFLELGAFDGFVLTMAAAEVPEPEPEAVVA